MEPKIRRRVLNGRNFSKFACYWIGFFFLLFAHWLQVNFVEVTLPQLEYHLHFSSGLISETDSIFLITFSIECLLGPTLLAILIIAIEIWVSSANILAVLRPLSLMTSRTTWALGHLGG